MRKKIAMVLAALLTAGLLAGCGSQSDALKDMKVEKYVTLGEYMGIPVQLASAAVDEAQEEELMRALYMDSVTAQLGGITDREVVLGDTVNIDYVGKKDDVAFQGGTDSGATLEIGSGRFIEGFEEGLIGAMPGETRDLELTFPEIYQNAGLAGQDVVFTVTVNFIWPTEYSDEVVAGIGVPDITTVEQMRQFVHDYLESNAQNTYRVSLENAVMDELVNGCVFQEIPAAILEKYRNNVQTSLEMDSASLGVDMETYCMYNYGMASETFLDQYAEIAARQSLAVQAVANAEDLNITDEELQENLEQFAAQGGYSTVEEFLRELDREEYREYFMFEKVLEFLTQNAQITEY
ncbi:MAG: FKBP-type peptidyl-prolyl cis-trans isomerase [Acetatifactor sp.]|nr:FKBP-type peptidyl-prolyl cis-trans isomerase [Acetatifactor sp.]